LVVEPARQRVAAEADNAAAVAVDQRRQPAIDIVEAIRQLLGAALGAELRGKRLGERCKAGDIGEQRSAMRAIGKALAAHERAAAVVG